MAYGRREAWRGYGQSLMPVGLVTAVAMGVLVLMALASGISIEAAVSDQHELTRQRFLGVISTLGVLLWGASVTICLFAASLLSNSPLPTDRRRQSRRLFFLASAAVTLVLLVDDLLLVHEGADDVVGYFIDFDRTRRQKDILEGLVFAGYGALYAVYGFAFRSIWRASDAVHFLVAALALFAVSVLIDFGVAEALLFDIPDYRDPIDLKSLIEEGAKLIGIACYTAFFFSEAAASLAPRPRSGMQRGPKIGQ